MAILLNAHEALFLLAELLHAHVPRLNAVLPLPLTAAPYDPAGQGHLISCYWEKRPTAAVIALIRHHRS